MNKQELIAEVAKNSNLSKAQAARTIDATFEAIKSTLKKGKKVSLIGFGSFLVRKRKARTGRNPKTGETIKIKASKVPAFSAGASLKKVVNK